LLVGTGVCTLNLKLRFPVYFLLVGTGVRILNLKLRFPVYFLLVGTGALCVIESVKAVSDIYAPLSGEVTAVNVELEDAPHKVNEDPYNSGRLEKTDCFLFTSFGRVVHCILKYLGFSNSTFKWKMH
jgi:hypothetical protein